METTIKISLILHIASGFTALLTGLIAILSIKGSKPHILSGKIYFWAMIIVALTAVVMAVFKELSFLFSIAIFSFYLTYTGYRSVKNKTANPNFTDWLVMSFTAIVSVWMIISAQMILVIFGVISIVNIYADLRFVRMEKPVKNAWLYRHIAKMCGAYIATVTAFMVTNVHFMPQIAVWLLPTVIGSPLIVYTIKKYRIKAAF